MVAFFIRGRPATRVFRVWVLLRLVALAAVSSARATDYYVNPGAADAYATVQSAVDAVAGQSEFNRANIFIAPGIYRERVTVGKPYVSFIGEGDSPQATTITFAMTYSSGNWGQVVEIQNNATAFMARNLTIENSTPDRNLSAALALRSVADRAIFDNVRVLGYQDTLLVDESSRQYFRRSFITGDADFIFGDATAVFDHCTVENTDYGWVTASSTNRTTANGFVFLDCTLAAGTDRNPLDDHTSAAPGTVYLGRPWLWWEPARMPSVTFIRTKMGRHIISAGWDPWNFTGVPGVNPNVNRDPLTRLSEFGSMDSNGVPLLDTNGDGTPTGRVAWADPMSADQAANYTLERIFGPVTFWNSETQPETSGIPYQSQGEDWHAIAQLALLPTQSGIASQPLNISTRVSVQTGDNVLIAGFILTGNAPKPVLLRARLTIIGKPAKGKSSRPASSPRIPTKQQSPSRSRPAPTPRL
jgi:pectinesterase